MSDTTKVFNFIRIYFIGRPYELNRLTYDETILFKNQEEIKSVIKANHLFYGPRYCSSILSILVLIKSTKYLNSSSSVFKRMLIYSSGFIPILLTYLFCIVKSDYYKIIRPVILSTREREKRLLKNKLGGTEQEISEIKILCDYSLKEREKIISNIGVTKCVLGTLKYYLLNRKT